MSVRRLSLRRPNNFDEIWQTTQERDQKTGLFFPSSKRTMATSVSKPPDFMIDEFKQFCEASKQKMLDKMEKIEDPAITFNDAASLSIRFPDPGPLPKNELIQFDGLAFAYPGKTPLFQKATANLDIKGRIGILGANGVSWKNPGRIIQERNLR